MSDPFDDLDDELAAHGARWRDVQPVPGRVPVDLLVPAAPRNRHRTTLLAAAAVLVAVGGTVAAVGLRDDGAPAPAPAVTQPPQPNPTTTPAPTTPAETCQDFLGRTRGRSGFEVEAVIFSGRVDPRWSLTVRESSALVALLRTSTAGAQRVKYGPDRLGGFLVHVETSARKRLDGLGLGTDFWVPGDAVDRRGRPIAFTPGPILSFLDRSFRCHPEGFDATFQPSGPG